MSYNEKIRHKKNDKLTQLVQNFFFKASNIIIQSRASSPPDANEAGNKLNKWFNIQLDDILSKEELKLWKLSNSIINEETNSILSLPPLVIEVYLDLRHLSPSQTLILLDLEDKNKSYTVAQGNVKNELILERWLLEFDLNTFDLNVNQLPSIYKNIMISFRVLYTFIRLLPCFKLRQNIANTHLNQSLSINYRILDGNLPIHSKGRIGLSKNLVDRSLKEKLMTKKFEPIITNVGSLRISVSYRSNCKFKLNDNEELLSSEFLKMDYRKLEEIPKEQQPQPQPMKENPHLKRLSIQSNYSLSPGSIFMKEFSPSSTNKLRRSSSSASRIQPFKVGSVSSNVPLSNLPSSQHQLTPPPPFLGNESLTNDNNSTTSLLAMLRHQRTSFSSQNLYKPIYVGSIDSSISHESGTTPRFSSSFGSRYRRQKSGSKIADGGGSSAGDDAGELDLFIKQLDLKPDLRLSISPQDSLERYQLMQNRNDLLSESMNAAILQHQSSSSSTKELRLINYEQPGLKLQNTYNHHNSNESAIIDEDDDHITSNNTKTQFARRYSRNNNNEEEEDLLFTMSDMNLK